MHWKLRKSRQNIDTITRTWWCKEKNRRSTGKTKGRKRWAWLKDEGDVRWWGVDVGDWYCVSKQHAASQPASQADWVALKIVIRTIWTLSFELCNLFYLSVRRFPSSIQLWPVLVPIFVTLFDRLRWLRLIFHSIDYIQFFCLSGSIHYTHSCAMCVCVGAFFACALEIVILSYVVWKAWVSIVLIHIYAHIIE